MSAVTCYFDFVSPYTYLALAQLPAFGQRHGIRWRLRPVLYGVLLDRTGLVGPVEVESKRRYTFADIRRAASLLELPLTGPPSHPFRSLQALRAVCAVDDPHDALRLTVALASACWGQGKDIAQPEVIAATATAVELPGDQIVESTGAQEVKDRLRESTDEALKRGVFGVPTFRLGEELFWGHDRLPHLAGRLSGAVPDPLAGIQALLDRPRGADRRGFKPRG